MDSAHHVSGLRLNIQDVALVLGIFVLFAGATALFATI